MSRKYSGSCHCGALQFSFEADEPLEVTRCNCSICRRTGFEHVFVPHAELERELDDSVLQEYRFNTGTAVHWFCSKCGIKAYYQPRSHPDCYSVNARCLDGYPDLEMDVRDFDGSRWEDNIDSLQGGNQAV